jgi:Protein of unknown function (Hypoth_ymh)
MGEPALETPREPPDHHYYGLVMFNVSSLRYLLAAVRFYESRLEQDAKYVRDDTELSGLLDQETLDSYPFGRDLDRTQRVRIWLEKLIAKADAESKSLVDGNLSHGWVRFLKSVETLYLAHLRRKRDATVLRATTSKGLLEAIDQELSKREEESCAGVFRTATPYPLVIDQFPPPAERAEPGALVPPAGVERPRAVVLESIEIRDLDLRRRCLDLFAQFHQDGQHDRLDTVISEATRILEARLRELAGADASSFGVELAALAFRPPSPRLSVSEVQAEQEAAHLMYRGIFGFVRNSAHHRLLGELQPERVLQIVGMVDYLISVAEAARRNLPAEPTSERGEQGRP